MTFFKNRFFLIFYFLSIHFIIAESLEPNLYPEFSPRKDIVILHYSDSESNRQIWLSDTKKPKNTQLLLSYSRSAYVIFSPKETALIENERSSSSEGEVRLYRREKGLRYVEDKSIDINEKIWKAAATKTKLPVDQMDHNYVYALKWINESKVIIGFDEMSFNGRGHSVYLEESTALFNIKTGKIEWMKISKAGRW